MIWDLKSVSDLITALAALGAAAGSIVAAIKSSGAKKASETSRQAVEEMRNDVRLVLQTTQLLQQNQPHTQNVQITLPPTTVGQALTEPRPIFQSEPQELPPAGQPQEQDESRQTE